MCKNRTFVGFLVTNALHQNLSGGLSGLVVPEWVAEANGGRASYLPLFC